MTISILASILLLAARTLTLFDDGEVVLTTPVAVGAADSPTPTGFFSVTDKLQDPNPNGAYGPFALGLSGRSEVISQLNELLPLGTPVVVR